MQFRGEIEIGFWPIPFYFREAEAKGITKRGAKNMAGTKAGGVAAAQTNKEKYGADFYARIGAAGGRKGRTGGFTR